MGIISLKSADNLVWLGRYSERVYNTLKRYFLSFDQMIDAGDLYYKEVCQRLNIPDVYGSKEHFLANYPFDPENPDSIFSNLTRAFDNALVMRDYIGSESLAYIQLAIYEMNKAKISSSPLIELQNVIDYLLAFYGCLDEQVDDIEVRHIIKVGRSLEGLDLAARFHEGYREIDRALGRLEFYIQTTELAHDKEALAKSRSLADMNEIPYMDLVDTVEHIFLPTFS